MTTGKYPPLDWDSLIGDPKKDEGYYAILPGKPNRAGLFRQKMFGPFFNPRIAAMYSAVIRASYGTWYSDTGKWEDAYFVPYLEDTRGTDPLESYPTMMLQTHAPWTPYEIEIVQESPEEYEFAPGGFEIFHPRTGLIRRSISSIMGTMPDDPYDHYEGRKNAWEAFKFQVERYAKWQEDERKRHPSRDYSRSQHIFPVDSEDE
jgi:hypothetical protein